MQTKFNNTMRMRRANAVILLALSLGLTGSLRLSAQQVESQQPLIPRVRLGLPQPVPRKAAEPSLPARAVADSSPWRPPYVIEVVKRPVALPVPAQLASDRPSLADLALPPDIGSTVTPLPLVPAQGNTDAPHPPADPLLPTPSAGPHRSAAPPSAPQPGLGSAITDPIPLELIPLEPVVPLPHNQRAEERQRTDAARAAVPQPPLNQPPKTPTVENRFESPPSETAASPAGPRFFSTAGWETSPNIGIGAWQAPYVGSDFSPTPFSPLPSSPLAEASPYRGKFAVPVQRPWVELGRPLYTGGIYPPAKEWFGQYNPVMPHFMVYGDFRTGAAINRNADGDADNWASRLNLDMDLEITATERLHAFMGPLDRAGDYTRLDFTDGTKFLDRTDIRLDNLFFEGDAGAIWGGWTDQDAPFDLPFTFGFLPVFYQNGIWANDNVIGAAFALPSKNSPLLKWSNYDATFFWASDQINSDAFAGDNNAAEFFGTAWFIEAYDGYIESDYAFVHDDVGGHRSYHNLSVAYTRRYFMRISNSIRYIANFGQSLPSDQRTADGHMLLVENSLISKSPNTLVPYLNFFYGQGRTQSLARANNVGGILNNTGINFETDGLTGYPTLDATGVNATGTALGVNILGADFQHQLILEVAALSANGQPQLRNAPGDEYAAGLRYQKPLSNAWIFRTDHMVGWRENARDLRGSRVELRWKF